MKILFLLGLIFFTVQVNAQNQDSLLIRNLLNRQVEGWNSGSIETFMQGYWKSDSLRFASGNTITYGWQSTFDRYKKRYSDKEKMGKLEFIVFEIVFFSPENALVFGRWILNRNQDSMKGLFTLTLKKQNESWKITADHTSSE